jgi:hypothetical protein
LHVGDAIHPQGGFADFLGKAALLALGKARQGQAQNSPLARYPGVLDPAQVEQAAATAGIGDPQERCLKGGRSPLAGRPLAGRHHHWRLGPVILGAMTEPLEGLWEGQVA